MSEIASYKGFTGSMDVSDEDDCLFGKILFINDLITYEGQTVAELKRAFKEAVDGYIEHCQEVGKEPNKPYSGSLNVRIGGERHKQVAQRAASQGISLNQFIADAVDVALSGGQAATSEYVLNNMLTATPMTTTEPSLQQMIDSHTPQGMRHDQSYH